MGKLGIVARGKQCFFAIFEFDVDFGIAAFLNELGIDGFEEGLCQWGGLYQNAFPGLGIEAIGGEECGVVGPNSGGVFCHGGGVYRSCLKSSENFSRVRSALLSESAFCFFGGATPPVPNGIQRAPAL